METLAALGHGFTVALTPLNLFWSLLGVTVGTAIGVLPGIGPALTVVGDLDDQAPLREPHVDLEGFAGRDGDGA